MYNASSDTTSNAVVPPPHVETVSKHPEDILFFTVETFTERRIGRQCAECFKMLKAPDHTKTELYTLENIPSKGNYPF